MADEPAPSAEDEDPAFAGEEESDGLSTPGKDFAAALAVGALAILAMVLAYRLPVPGDAYTAPGLLPFLTGLSLLAMAFALGAMARRRNGGRIPLGGFNPGLFLADDENRRTLLLLGIMFVYVVLVDILEFEIDLFSLGGLMVRFSGFELVTILILTLILRIFWRAPLTRCLLVSFLGSLILSAIFRYGFKVLLPGLA